MDWHGARVGTSGAQLLRGVPAGRPVARAGYTTTLTRR